ncbi:putative sulfate exporter family transporter [Novosphingobium sp. ERW19]|uniref:YeiH family protein n=1 Tax=Novosphingobium sp. ERW19 TaxID=2726186 RepID=UPI001456E246|nr:putative sulfate exporter family transporter [Novosphingobium sp. ERW19]NLR40545.1 putative sulfate exporter family transporter [Novosphingobium sp. ERW19]
MQTLTSRARALAPGLGVALVIAAAATFLSEHYTAPVMLYALLLGMAFNFLMEGERTRLGIEFASKALLRTGVALLGMRIGWAQVTALGWGPVVMVLLLVAVTILASILLARLMGFNPLFGFLSGGATAICGASAALAISASLPAHERKEQATLFTVIGVSALSTLAMIAYPVIAHAVGLDNRQAGVFIGATIHDVAQVVGAGYAISPEAGDTATIVKLLRVAMLLPVILVAGQITRRQATEGTTRPPLLPWFVAAFIGLVVLNSVVAMPEAVTDGANDLSRWCLVTSLSAIGMKTQLGDIVKVGLKPVVLMLIETALLAAMVLAILHLHLV